MSFVDDTLPDLLYQPTERIGLLRDRLVRETIERCYRGHPYYSQVMREHGLTPDDIRCVDDLARLPIVRKQDFLRDPEAFRLQLDELPAEERLLRDVVYTTGTTSGQPAPIYNTAWDALIHFVVSGRCSEMLGLTTNDVIANVFPLTALPNGGYVRSFTTAGVTGCAIVATNTGRPIDGFDLHRSLDEAVDLVSRHRATVLYGVASFIRRMLIRAKERGVDFSAVRACMITGEASSVAMRQDMRHRMRELGQADPRIWNRYGATESFSLIECVEGGGWHNPAPDQLLIEIVDPESGQRLPNGAIGLHVITHLNRRGTVLIRYALGDLVAKTDEPCPNCGRTSERVVSQPVRTKDIVKVKGMLLNTDALVEALTAVPDLDEFQVVLQKSDPADPFSLDELLLRIAAPASAWQAVAEAAARRTLEVTSIRPRLEQADASAIFDPERHDKPRRLVDLRPPTE